MRMGSNDSIYALCRAGFNFGLAVALLILVAACGDSAAGSPPTETAQPTAAEAPRATATATTDESEVDEPGTPTGEIVPPAAELMAASGAQVAEIGTYCWTEGAQGLCADFAGLPVPSTALVVAQGEAVTMRVPGISHIANVHLEIYDHAAAEPSNDHQIIYYPPPESTSVPVSDDGTTVTMVADLPSGEYVVSLFVTFPQDTASVPTPNAVTSSASGDAQYGFHIVVR